MQSISVDLIALNRNCLDLREVNPTILNIGDTKIRKLYRILVPDLPFRQSGFDLCDLT